MTKNFPIVQNYYLLIILVFDIYLIGLQYH
jgi:hypothetical protein